MAHPLGGSRRVGRQKAYRRTFDGTTRAGARKSCPAANVVRPAFGSEPQHRNNSIPDTVIDLEALSMTEIIRLQNQLQQELTRRF